MNYLDVFISAEQSHMLCFAWLEWLIWPLVKRFQRIAEGPAESSADQYCYSVFIMSQFGNIQVVVRYFSRSGWIVL